MEKEKDSHDNVGPSRRCHDAGFVPGSRDLWQRSRPRGSDGSPRGALAVIIVTWNVGVGCHCLALHMFTLLCAATHFPGLLLWVRVGDAIFSGITRLRGISRSSN